MTSHKDDLRSRVLSKEGEKNWDLIFPPKPKKERWVPPPLPEEKKPYTGGTVSSYYDVPQKGKK